MKNESIADCSAIDINAFILIKHELFRCDIVPKDVLIQLRPGDFLLAMHFHHSISGQPNVFVASHSVPRVIALIPIQHDVGVALVTKIIRIRSLILESAKKGLKAIYLVTTAPRADPKFTPVDLY